MTATMTQVLASGQAGSEEDIPDPQVPERARRRTHTAPNGTERHGTERNGTKRNETSVTCWPSTTGATGPDGARCAVRV